MIHMYNRSVNPAGKGEHTDDPREPRRHHERIGNRGPQNENEKVENLRRLCKGSSEVLHILNSTIAPEDAVLVKLDLEQFYL